MKITLIQCPAWCTKSPPYNLALIAAALKREGHEPICLDFNIEFYNYCKEKGELDTWLINESGSYWHDERYILGLIKKYESYINKFIYKVLDIDSPVIGFTIYAISQIFSDQLVKMIKERNPDKIIIFGGPECFRIYQGVHILQKKPWVDAICLGESERCLPNLLEIIQGKGKIISTEGFAYRDDEGNIIDCGNAELIHNLDVLPFADYSCFDLDKYTAQLVPIATSRGCICRCSFCNESVHWEKYRNRSANNIYEEIIYQLNRYPTIKEFFFNDSLVNGNIKMLEELCDLLIQNNLQIGWSGQAIIRKDMTKEFLNKLKRSGCSTLLYGLESGSNKILKLMKKGCDAKLAEQVIRQTYEAGIGLTFNIIVGFLSETEVEFKETADFIKKNIVYSKCIALNPLYILKDSELYRDREKLGILFSQASDGDIFWYTSDNLNNYEERLRRLNICKSIIGNQASTDIGKFSINKREFI